jgi:SAM-dependent methyltransferase
MKCLLCGKVTNSIITDKLRSNEKRKVFYCKQCKLGFLDHNKLDPKSLKQFYKNEYRTKFKPKLSAPSDPAELFEIYSNFQGDRINKVRNIAKKDMKLLEIGCSAGMFLFHIKKYVKEVVGIDYDTRSAEFAAKKCGCRVFDKDIEETGLKKESFDIICMFQSLEHIDNPLDFVKRISRYLRPGGILCVEVPNLHDVLAYGYSLPGHFNFYFHSAHLWYFTEKSLLSLMRKSGFKGKVFFTQDYNFLNHMHWLSADIPQGDCISGLSRPKLALRANLEPSKKKGLSNFFNKVNDDYTKLLSNLKITSNIHFIGRKIV